jgi:hypothetical protein
LGILDRISDWRARRRFGPVAGAMNENMEGVRVAKFATMLGASGRDRRSFLDAKWRLSEGGWSPRTEAIPRPATAEEVALKLGLTVDEVRSRDTALVEWGAKYVAEDPYWRYADPILTTTIDEAQDWWENTVGRFHNPDGTPKTGRARRQAFRDSPPDE